MNRSRNPSSVRNLAVTSSALILALLAIWYLLQSPNTNMGSATPTPSFTYSTVPGVFHQDDPATSEKFEYLKHNFGLVDRSYPTDTAKDDPAWQRFAVYLSHLQKAAAAGEFYKLLYLGRHGEGDHNVAEAFYGTKAWDDYWSKLDGNGTLYWADAHLTEKGRGQALSNNAFIGEQLGWAKMPAPQKYYVSPMFRCLQTAELTYSGLKLPEERPFKPVIKELAREVLGEHTCDRRSSKTYIREHYPEWEIEEGFTEEDELWQPDHRETHEEHDIRTTALLDDLFEHDGNAYLSITSHSGAIASLLRVAGHREFRLPTGGMVPVLVKATRAR